MIASTSLTKMISSSLLLVLLFSFLGLFSRAAAAPRLRPRQDRPLNLKVQYDGDNLTPVLDKNFPDPAIVRDADGTWYAFATNSNGVTVQVARAEGDDPVTDAAWTLLDQDALPERTWFLGEHTWAPDVRVLGDGSYIMYFSGQIPDSHQHCIGVARSRDGITGPYTPDPEPWACPRDEGGAIDASGFLDEGTGRRYVVYKIDGNSKGEFTPCGTGVDDPSLRTPLLLQRVDSDDGATKIGEPVELLDRVPELDGALVEAPNLVRRRGQDGLYVLWYSSHCFTDPLYDVKYAYSDRVEGPYVRGPEGSVLGLGDYGLNGPGGMSSVRVPDGDVLLFHANCDKGRCLYAAEYDEV